MELKLKKEIDELRGVVTLLIEPYGIEIDY